MWGVRGGLAVVDEKDAWGSSCCVEEENTKEKPAKANGCGVRLTRTYRTKFQAWLAPALKRHSLTSASELQAALAAFKNAPRAEFHTRGRHMNPECAATLYLEPQSLAHRLVQTHVFHSA